jgi:hypothetical protein
VTHDPDKRLVAALVAMHALIGNRTLDSQGAAMLAIRIADAMLDALAKPSRDDEASEAAMRG